MLHTTASTTTTTTPTMTTFSTTSINITTASITTGSKAVTVKNFEEDFELNRNTRLLLLRYYLKV